MFESHELDASRLCKDRFQLISELHQRVSFKNAISSSEMEEYGSHLLICVQPRKISRVPKILMCGLQSASAQIWGRDWASSAHKTHSLEQPHLNEIFTYGYKVAADHGWYCEETEGFVDGPEGMRFLSFVRYIRTVRSEAGFNFFICAGVIRHRVLQ